MIYESPSIVQRVQIEALLADVVESDQPPKNPQSDVNKKENIVPVTWSGPSRSEIVRYETPAITRRDRIAGMADSVQSDTQPKPDAVPSDVNAKDNIVAVGWAAPQGVEYEAPSITRREMLAGMSDGAQSDTQPKPDGLSDVNVKDNIVPVWW